MAKGNTPIKRKNLKKERELSKNAYKRIMTRASISRASKGSLEVLERILHRVLKETLKETAIHADHENVETIKARHVQRGLSSDPRKRKFYF